MNHCVGGTISCVGGAGSCTCGTGGTTSGVMGVAEVQVVHHLPCLIILEIMQLMNLIPFITLTAN